MHNFSNIDEAIIFLHENIHVARARIDFLDAARYLGVSRDERALKPLLEALQYGGEYIRSTAALGLGSLGRKEAVPYLIQSFTHDSGLYVRCDAALALGQLCVEEALPIFLQHFASENFEVQKRIITSTGRIKTEPAKEVLLTIQDIVQMVDISEQRREFLRKLITEALNLAL